VTQALTRRAKAELGEDAEIVDFAELWVASGRTVYDLSQELAKELGYDISRELVSKVINGAPGAADRIAHARREGGHGLAEEALHLADNADAQREELQKVKQRIDTRLWLAARWNRAELSDKPDVNINISLPGLHLEALRARVIPPNESVPMLTQQVSDDAQDVVIEEVNKQGV
jgi:hypothetical protein